MGAPYHQFCPVSKAMELLDERWTLLLVRELVTGSERFNELRRGLPRMSPTLLSRRLQQLARAAGVVRRVEDGGRTVLRFRFTDPSVAERDWWIVIDSDDVDVCDEDPGHPVDATLTGSLRGVVRWWMGEVSWPALVRSGEVDVQAPSGVRRALPGWFSRSPFATVPRPPASSGRVRVG